MKIGHLVILNAVQDIEDIQGQEYWKYIVHTILRIGIIRALNERSDDSNSQHVRGETGRNSYIAVS